MHLLVTGGTGFVLAHVVRQHLLADPEARATVVDLAAPDGPARRFFAGLEGRMRVVVTDLTDPAAYATLPGDVDAVVHGAAMTPHRYTALDGAEHWPERDGPLRIVETNIMATARLLDWWRGQPGGGRFVYLSSGSVYAPEVPGVEFVGEDDHVRPDALYDITKYTGERLTRRFGALYGRPMVSVRLSSVFGAMDRATGARHVRCIPQRLAMNALAGRLSRVVSAEATGDYVSAADVARAIRLVVAAPEGRLAHSVYNIANARLTTISELQALLAPLTGGCPVEVVAEAEAEITQPASLRTGKYAAYDTTRLAADTGWSPRPLAETLAEYVEWLKAEAAAG